MTPATNLTTQPTTPTARRNTAMNEQTQTQTAPAPGWFQRGGRWFGPDGRDAAGRDLMGLDRTGHTANGVDREGFHADGMCRATGTLFNRNGYGRDGYDKAGFDIDGVHRNGTAYDDEGYAWDGYDDASEFTLEDARSEWVDPVRFASTGFDRGGFDHQGFHRTGSLYGPDGHTWDGYDRAGLDREGNLRPAGWDGSGHPVGYTRYATAEEAVAAGWEPVDRRASHDVSEGWGQNGELRPQWWGMLGAHGYEWVRASDGKLSEGVWLAEELNRVGSKGAVSQMYPPDGQGRYGPRQRRDIVEQYKLGLTEVR